MKLTAQMLRDKNACQEQVEKFQQLYPDGVEVTKAACVAVADVFDWKWAARNFLSDAARQEHDRIKNAAWQELNLVTAAARQEYDRVEAAAFGRLAETIHP